MASAMCMGEKIIMPLTVYVVENARKKNVYCIMLVYPGAAAGKEPYSRKGNVLCTGCGGEMLRVCRGG